MRARDAVRPVMLTLALCALPLVGACGGGETDTRWLVVERDGILQIHRGAGLDFPQYAALHLDSGYLRMIPGPDSGWGTSVVLLPAFWSGGIYHQGAPVVVTATEGDDLLLHLAGTIGGLSVEGTVTLHPPAAGGLTADVRLTATGDVPLDDRPGEAFKPVMLSSMHISDDQWDARSAAIGGLSYPLPLSGWIAQPPVTATRFELRGGTSAWKTNAPTVAVSLRTARPITGWVTAADDPNLDNVGFWAASDTVLPSWEYTITARL